MSLLYLESFDLLPTSDTTALTNKGWTVTNGGFASRCGVVTSPARTGTKALQCGDPSNTGYIQKQALVAEEHATFTIGLAYYRNTSTNEQRVIELCSDALATTHVSLTVTSAGAVKVYRGASGTLLGTGSSNIPANTWTYVELKAVLSDTVGTVDVRLNNSSILALTAQDTKNGGTKTVFDGWKLGNISGNDQCYIDDVYLSSGAGSVNTGFIGDMKIEVLRPNANGNSSQLVGSDGNSVNNYLLVNSTTTQSTNYVGSATTGDEDTYGMTDLTATTGSIAGIQQVLYASKSDAGSRSIATVLRESSTEYVGSDIALGNGSYTYVSQLREVDPATSSAWTIAGLNAAEFGARVRP